MTIRRLATETIEQALLRLFGKYPLRTCRWQPGLSKCEVCESDIKTGERYFDGGYGRRAHESCVLPGKAT